uniref:Odorant receptor 67d-like n=1 Tax=Drosophila rhopaloa TaxID=1041015 RepID=A0A6P4EY12_DRORH
FVGAEITDPDFKMSCWTYNVICVCSMFLLCTGYTVYVGVVIDGDWLVLVQSACQAGAAIQGSAKLFCVLMYRKYLLEVWDFLHFTYESYENQGPNYKKALQDALKFLITSVKGFGLVHLSAHLACIIFPAAYYALYSERLMVMQFLVPGLDPKTIMGYWILTVLHTTCIVCGFFGNFAADMYIFVFIANAPLVKNILKCKLEDLDTKLEALNGQSILREDVHEDMVAIVNWHKKYL